MTEKKCDIPKNIRQIGHTISDKKIYIEDYVMTYIKQLYREPFEEEKVVILVGEEKNKDGAVYFFISGVVELDAEINKYTEILENENMNKIVKVKEDFYNDKDIMGLGIISKNERFGIGENAKEYISSGLVGNIVIIYDINQEEKVYTYLGENFIRVKGYYVYYDRNESMQNYMLCMKDGKSIEYGYAKTEIADKTIDEKIRTYTIPKNTVYTSKNLDFNKYKKYVERRWLKKIRYCSILVGMVAILLAGVVKMHNLENITRKKAEELLMESKEVMSNNDINDAKIYERDNKNKSQKKSNREKENNTIEKEKINDTNNNEEKNKKEKKKQKEIFNEEKENILDYETKDNEPRINQKKVEIERQASENKEDILEEKRELTDEKKKVLEKETSSKTQYYIVKKGDALVDISRRMYGTIKKVEVIKKINGLKDEDKIYIGQRLVMP